MRTCRLILVWFSWAAIAAAVGFSQTPAPAKGKAASTPPVRANLIQLMRGILYPSSNVIFFAQNENPDDVPPAKDPSLAVNPLASSYGKWLAVENSALALTEAADLLMTPGRKCANGLPVPIRNADWPKFVQGLREAGVTAYKAAQSKNMDNIVMAADVMTTACSNCHDKYREKPTLADRCK
jgi:hypothetical protein